MNTPCAATPMESISISGGRNNSWIHLSNGPCKGDYLIIQNIDLDKLNTNYPNSDIIVFHRPDNLNEIIIHRIVAKTEVSCTLYFFEGKWQCTS